MFRLVNHGVTLVKISTAKFQNFKSLTDVELSFRNLTILVGANASGKSNCLEALGFVRTLLGAGSLPPVELMQRYLRFNSDRVNFNLTVEDSEKKAEYSISITVNKKSTLIACENLQVDGIEVIDIINGEGKVSDEDGKNDQKYQSDPESIEGLALRAAGNFGNKPFTKKLSSYIRNWEFYNIDPDRVRQYSHLLEKLKVISQPSTNSDKIPGIDEYASEVQEVLNYWAKNEIDKFEEVSKELEKLLNISLNLNIEGKQLVNIVESDGKKFPLASMSDGTLRLIAYLILLYRSGIPPLIGIEEPERNFHPGILKDVASIMKRLSKRTQVVLTTHSSQLLDCFKPEEISSEVSVILLNKKNDVGTKACLLDKLAENRDDLLDWMNDFGLGIIK